MLICGQLVITGVIWAIRDYNNRERLWEDVHGKPLNVLKIVRGIYRCEQMEMLAEVGQTVGLYVCVCLHVPVCVCIPGTAGYAMLSCAVLRCRLLFELGQGRAEGLRMP